jgi:integrase/recombinase XerD
LSPCLEEGVTQHQQFVKERLYLKNVSPRTIEWHEQSLKWLGIEDPTEDDCKAVVIRMREAGLKASSVNCRLRSINAYLKWNKSGFKIPKLKEPKVVLSIFGKNEIRTFASWKPKNDYDRRLSVLVLMLADVGARISELLTLKWANVDFDNCLVKVCGKGDRERIIPFSQEMRKHLYRLKQIAKFDLVFCTKEGRPLLMA